LVVQPALWRLRDLMVADPVGVDEEDRAGCPFPVEEAAKRDLPVLRGRLRGRCRHKDHHGDRGNLGGRCDEREHAVLPV
jgi:hypothetical protein